MKTSSESFLIQADLAKWFEDKKRKLFSASFCGIVYLSTQLLCQGYLKPSWQQAAEAFKNKIPKMSPDKRWIFHRNFPLPARELYFSVEMSLEINTTSHLF